MTRGRVLARYVEDSIPSQQPKSPDPPMGAPRLSGRAVMQRHVERSPDARMTADDLLEPEFDLRSDAVTQPTEAMWDAMRAARLGWASLGEDASVAYLEEAGAELSGKEA